MPDPVPTPDLTAQDIEYLAPYGGWDYFCKYYRLNPFIEAEYNDAVTLLSLLIERDGLP
ncbi:hypothetical protein Q8F55_001541 [Vanrija albida]|uniref:Uncharacterized protein n=1 Tax=Vanrija albida TaxID=181172 RepID=A0ABR3QGC9_9TREE